ncbi:hypothetical protein DKX38_028483 [Salix brachista]|uniref:Leucine-rich repeat-containing N-terminal plant-type domain-containing protein n=1 Tax=Salix brachista TaxID=2182728 RepID=A0A5N5JHG1_9ROSI|nr:hypothetical protein DKX38_028483 [Salix brachista]
MSALEVLDLSNNGLSGNIPEQLVEGSLSLRGLVLSNNHLKGQLLWRSFNLAYLTDLILSGNQLTGILLDSLSNGSRLEALDVSLNNLTVVVSSSSNEEGKYEPFHMQFGNLRINKDGTTITNVITH